ncbi:efflux RND transporter periplasmic adaptor subunit [Flavobacteriaceae bacterium]|jgi:HlyD family secretion protein|nr:efflux RND transporter periplasmic adaptor subunit [Flavobacteriaceae bacterium]MDB2672662.1 efflux RND transporter periplasmic adaptor subunit [Flavobacteriaceae bacterium]MDB9821550.1 efflux RND transporter periplasmic adaptor subunit [Flavobacteriaceae bacterium]MDB9824114.1 efflux RND transporter periplasmic adaptor subunit [Flavobacteriaceae bacterium]MDB9941805.1 efflux RND transporter periplasmic adaptor subunit [Flavobacteriaceae bacterium]
MNKFVRYTLILLVIFGVLFAAAFFIKSNSKATISFETKTALITSIEQKTVATGKVIPEDEVEVKPQVQGILQSLFVEEGDYVEEGDLLAKIKVVADEGQLNSAKGRLATAKIVLKNAQVEYNRNKSLFDKEIISQQEFQTADLTYSRAKQDLANAQSDFEIIKLGSAGGSASANTNVRATVAGTVLELPVKEGDQVIESNSFNAGTTIAIIADLNKMIFEGKVDEAEVGKLSIGMPLSVSLGAIQDKEFEAKLKFIAPKGNEEQGAVQFKIEGDVTLDSDFFVRAGYSANASLVLERKDSILALPEALMQFDKDTEQPFVEIELEEQKFERRDIIIGISDGMNVEIISGITLEDKIKVWNKTEAKKKGDDETSDDNE